MALLLLPLHTSLALLLPLPTQLPPVRRCPSPQCQATAISELGAALHQSLSAAPSSPAEANGSWLRLATLLCDGVYELAAEAAAEADADADSAEPPSEEALVEARELCSGLLERLAAEAPALYAVAKFSAKRNEALGSRRGVERCLAELGLLLGTSAALTPEEVEPLLATLRPVTRTAASSRRVAAYLVLCRGFSSPGAGKSGGWRKGSGTVQQLLREAPRPPSLESQLEVRPELRAHSRALRATLPFLETPLRLWLARLPAQERPTTADGATAAALLLHLAGCGPEGVRVS